MYINKVQRVGNSIGVTLPADYLKELKLRPGDYVIIRLAEGSLTIVPQATALPARENVQSLTVN